MGLNRSRQQGTHTTTHLPPLMAKINVYFYLILFKLNPDPICGFSESHLRFCKWITVTTSIYLHLQKSIITQEIFFVQLARPLAININPLTVALSPYRRRSSKVSKLEKYDLAGFQGWKLIQSTRFNPPKSIISNELSNFSGGLHRSTLGDYPDLPFFESVLAAKYPVLTKI